MHQNTFLTTPDVKKISFSGLDSITSMIKPSLYSLPFYLTSLQICLKHRALAKRGGKKLGLVWRNRKKISQIINDYLS
jgi:hypothetical protein